MRRNIGGGGVSIKVVHKENGGLSSARNEGLRRASGEYVYCVDSDDYLEEGCLRQIKEALSSGADVYEVGEVSVRNGNSEFIAPIASDTPLDPVNYIERKIKERSLWLGAPHFVCRLELFFNFPECLFPEGVNHEDVYLMPRILLRAKKIQPLQVIVYYYVMEREGSISQERKLKDLLDRINVVCCNVEYFEKNAPERIKQKLQERMLSLYLSVPVWLYKKEKGDRKILLEKLKEKAYLLDYIKEDKKLLFLKRIINLFGFRAVGVIGFIRGKMTGRW